jgi:hypothetical protein
METDLPLIPTIEEKSRNSFNFDALIFRLLVGLIIVIVAVLIFWAGIFYQKNKSLSENKLVPTPTTSPQESVSSAPVQNETVSSPIASDSEKLTASDSSKTKNIATFSSQNLKISFSYPLSDKQDKITTLEKVNKVYVYNAKKNYTTGQYVEVFEKEKTDNNQEAIIKSVFKGEENKNCPIKEISVSGLSDDFQSYSVSDNGKNANKDEKCPKPYSTNGGLAYFIVDKNHPEKLLFIYLDQNDYVGADNKPWQNTISIIN